MTYLTAIAIIIAALILICVAIYVMIVIEDRRLYDIYGTVEGERHPDE